MSKRAEKQVIETQGIKYAGSKLRIIPYIIQMIDELPDVVSILDGFSGTTRVSQTLAQRGYRVTSSDISYWSEVFGNCYLISKKPDAYYSKYLERLNSLPGKSGWFTKHYGADENGKKRPFQLKNTKKLDAIRAEIDILKLPQVDKDVLLTSLILALDAVDSTLGHHASYLSSWAPRAHKDLSLKLPKRFKHRGGHRVIRDDIFNVIEKNEFDLAYFDPPYGSNNEKMPPSRVRYASYYHIWTSVIKNDRPKVFGKVNRREDSRDLVAGSVFEDYRKAEDGEHIAMKALRELIEKTRAKYILLSYSSGGRATKEELNKIMNEAGKVIKVMEIDYKKNIMATMRSTNQWINHSDDKKHYEYLFLMKKDSPR